MGKEKPDKQLPFSQSSISYKSESTTEITPLKDTNNLSDKLMEEE